MIKQEGIVNVELDNFQDGDEYRPMAPWNDLPKSHLKIKRNRATIQILDALLGEMENNHALHHCKIPGPDGSRMKRALWLAVAQRLNRLGLGQPKTVQQWQKSWSTMVKNARDAAVKSALRTDNCEPPLPLGQKERRILAVVGELPATPDHQTTPGGPLEDRIPQNGELLLDDMEMLEPACVLQWPSPPESRPSQPSSPRLASPPASPPSPPPNKRKKHTTDGKRTDNKGPRMEDGVSEMARANELIPPITAALIRGAEIQAQAIRDAAQIIADALTARSSSS